MVGRVGLQVEKNRGRKGWGRVEGGRGGGSRESEEREEIGILGQG